MKTMISLAAAMLVMPSILQAQSRSRPARPASRAAFRSATPVARISPTPRVYQTVAAQVSAGVKSNPALNSYPATSSPAAQQRAIQAVFSGGQRARGGSWSKSFGRPTFQPKGSFGARRVDASTGESAQTESPPPYLYTPGALIRTEGLGYTATPTNDARWQTKAEGYAIVQDPNKAILLDPFPGIHVGPADKLLPPTPGRLGSASGRNAITANNVPLPEAYSSGGSSDHNRDEGGKPDDPSGHGNGKNKDK